MLYPILRKGESYSTIITQSHNLIIEIDIQKNEIKNEIEKANIQLKKDKQEEIDEEYDKIINEKTEKIQKLISSYNDTLESFEKDNTIILKCKKENFKEYCSGIKKYNELINKVEEEFTVYEISFQINNNDKISVTFQNKEIKIKQLGGEIFIFDELNEEVKMNLK